MIIPHLIWLFDNNYITLKYGIHRTGGVGDITAHFIFPLTFILKQIIILLPLLIMSSLLLKKLNLKKLNLIES